MRFNDSGSDDDNSLERIKIEDKNISDLNLFNSVSSFVVDNKEIQEKIRYATNSISKTIEFEKRISFT